MKVRIRLESETRCTVHIAPSRLDWLFGAATYQDFEAELRGREWVTHDNRPVAPAVADAIEAELTRACVGDRHNKFRT